MLVRNFNHERWVISAGTLRSSRLCFEESIHEALTVFPTQCSCYLFNFFSLPFVIMFLVCLCG